MLVLSGVLDHTIPTPIPHPFCFVRAAADHIAGAIDARREHPQSIRRQQVRENME